jgi:hypothetical protein
LVTLAVTALVFAALARLLRSEDLAREDERQP